MARPRPRPDGEPGGGARASAPPAEARAAVRERLISHYRIRGLLGSGSMGEVYVAEDETLRRGVALKSIKADRRLDPGLRARFLREARVLSQLDHPNICRVFDFVATEEADCIVLELIEGRDLRRLIEAGVDRRRALELAQEITSALAAAHAAGIVHRDLKPGNVMVTVEGTAKVLDFGLSRMRGQEDLELLDPRPPAEPDGDGSLEPSAPDAGAPRADAAGRTSTETLAGEVIGTLRYMSPEQARGEAATAASDMYCLGLLLQELFTREPAFDAELTAVQAIEQARSAQTRPVRGVDRDLAGLIESLKSAAPSDRPTAAETLRRLQEIQRKPARRLRRGLAAALVLVAVAGAVKYTLDVSRERARARLRVEAALEMMETLFTEQVPVLAEVGRLDAFEGAARGVQAYFTRIADEEPTEREQLQLAKLLNLIGRVRQLQGRHGEALERFREALELSSRLAEGAGADPETLLTLGASHFYIGELALRSDGNAALALERFREYLAAAERSALVDPDRLRADREVAYARGSISGMLLELGRPEEAREGFELDVRTWRKLHEQHPDDPVIFLDLADSLSWLARAHKESGDPGAAQAILEEELACREALLQRDPRNAEARARLSYCLNYLARLHVTSGSHSLALERARRGFDLLAEVSRLDPANEEHKSALEALGTTLKLAEEAAEGQ